MKYLTTEEHAEAIFANSLAKGLNKGQAGSRGWCGHDHRDDDRPKRVK